MKAIPSITRFLPGVILSIALMATSIEVSAQNNRNKHKFDNNKDKEEYRDDHSNSSDHFEGRNDERSEDHKHYKGHNRDRDDDNYVYSDRSYSRPTHYEHNCYTHPAYGRVYQRFDDQPIVFRHSHGDYYYHGTQFYTYRDGVGYCPAESPREVYFNDLPFECNRVHVNGQVFFRHGELYFSHSNRGYVIVPSPLEVNFSLRF